MSTSLYRLLVFLLCVSHRLCDARRLGPTEKMLETSHNRFGTKSGEENEKAEVAPEEKRAAVSMEGSRTEREQVERLNGAEVAGHEGQNAKTTKDDSSRGRLTSSSSSKNVSRTWKVPQKNRSRDNEHPSFNLDYMQPVTHPPHHN